LWDDAAHVVDYMTEDGQGTWHGEVHGWLEQANFAALPVAEGSISDDSSMRVE
jgi:hypothetical protein